MRVTDQDYPPPPDFNSSMDNEARRRARDQQYRRQAATQAGMPPPDAVIDRTAPKPAAPVAPPAPSRIAGAVRGMGGKGGAAGLATSAVAEGLDIAELVRDPNATKGDVAMRVAEGGTRMAGAGAGAWLGAKTGAAVGGIAGPPGALAGGVVGSLAGGAMGYAAGNKAVDLAKNEMQPEPGTTTWRPPSRMLPDVPQLGDTSLRSLSTPGGAAAAPGRAQPADKAQPTSAEALFQQAKDSNDISQLNLGPNSGVIKGQTSGRTMVVRDGMVMGDGMKDPRAMGDISTLDSSAVWANKPYFDQLRAERQARESRGPRVVQLGADDAARTERRNLALGSREERGVARWMSNQAIQNRAIDAELQGIDSLDNFRMGQLEAEAIRSTGQARRDDIAASLDMARLDQLNQQSTLANQLRAETDPARRQAMQDELLLMQGKSPNENRLVKVSTTTGEVGADGKALTRDALYDSRTQQTIDPFAQTGAAAQKKTATMKDVEETAKASGRTVNQVIRDMEKDGVKIQGGA